MTDRNNNKDNVMTTEEKRDLAIQLIRRSIPAIEKLATDIQLLKHTHDGKTLAECQLAWAERTLESLYELVGEFAPDQNYWKDTYVLDGTHAILTEEGWEPAAVYEGEEVEVLDSINAPV